MNGATVTLPMSDFNLLKRSLSAAIEFRLNQIEGSDNVPLIAPSRMKEIKQEYETFRSLFCKLNSDM